MITCRIEVEVCVSGEVVRTTMWPKCNIMATGHTMAWATRQFNKYLREADRDEIVTVGWVSIYPDSMHRPRIHGRLSGVNGKRLVRSGIFEV